MYGARVTDFPEFTPYRKHKKEVYRLYKVSMVLHDKKWNVPITAKNKQDVKRKIKKLFSNPKYIKISREIK